MKFILNIMSQEVLSFNFWSKASKLSTLSRLYREGRSKTPKRQGRFTQDVVSLLSNE